MDLSFYTKEFEKKVLLETYFSTLSEKVDKNIEKACKEYLNKEVKGIEDSVKKLSDNELIKLFNTIKPKRIFGITYDQVKFLGKYYTYDGNELKLENSFEKLKMQHLTFLQSLNEREYNLVKAIINAVIKELLQGRVFHWIDKFNIGQEYMKLTGLTLGFTGKIWTKIYQHNIVVSEKKRFVFSPEYIVSLAETIKEFEELETFITDIEKVEEIPEDLFDTIVDEVNGCKIDHITALKQILRTAIENHLKDIKEGVEIPKHILIVGDVATAKTMFLLEVARLKGALYISGDMRLGKGGLTELIMETKPKILLIDEIQHMDSKTLGVLLSLGETGQIGMITREMQDLAKLNIMIIATTHPDDLDKLIKKTRGQGILDRFLIYKLPNYTRDQIRELIKSVLVKRYKASKDIAEYIANKLIEKGIYSIRSAIRIYGIARDNKEVIDMLIKGLVEVRE